MPADTMLYLQKHVHVEMFHYGQIYHHIIHKHYSIQ